MPHLKIYESVMPPAFYLIRMAFLPWPANRLEFCVTGNVVMTSRV